MWEFEVYDDDGAWDMNRRLDEEYRAFVASVKSQLGAHGHCLTCHMAVCSDDADCPVTACPQRCGARMHACKLNEHEAQVCSLSTVQCLNAEFGCPVTLPRYQQGQHLLHCPASVVVCPRRWCRKTRACVEARNPLPVPSNARESSSLAVQFAIGDQQQLHGFPVADDADEITCPPSPPVDEHNPSIRKGPFFQLPEPMRYVWTHHKAKELRHWQEEQQKVAKNVMASPNSLFLDLDVFSQFLWQEYFHSDHRVMMCCGQVFRRDEFSKHYGDLHVDVQLAVGERFSKPCPLQQYGCDVEVSRLSPSPPGSHLRYDHRHSTFALDHSPSPARLDNDPIDNDQKDNVSCNPPCSDGNSHGPPVRTQVEELTLYGYDAEDEWSPLLNLPPEVLEIILWFLDALSLRQLSCVCHHLRQVCYNLLVTRGLVLQNWEKIVDHLGRRWVVPHYKLWSFSTASTISRSGWYWSNSAFDLTDHMSLCAHFNRCDHLEAAKHVHRWKQEAKAALQERKETAKLSPVQMRRIEKEMSVLWCETD